MSDPQDPMVRYRSIVEQHLQSSLEAAQRLGTPLELHSQPFLVSADQVASAVVTGPRRYMIRRRRIEQGKEQLLAAAHETWLTLAHVHATSTAAFERAWRAWVSTIDASALNRLIEAHNQWYPAEANLPMSVQTGEYITPDGRDYHEELVTEDWLLAQFPPNLATAQATAQAATRAS